MDETSEKKPMNEMLEALMKVARGDYSVQVELSGKNDEFDSLAMGLNMMIDDIRTSQEALQFSDAAFRSIHESVIATDMEYTITHWNEVSESIYGIKASEAIGKKLFDVIEIVETSPGENAGRFKTLETQGYYQDEQLQRTKCSELWVDVSVQAIEDNGKRYGWVALATDITERKRTGEQLRLVESAVKASISAVSIADLNGKLIYVNPALVDMFGYDNPEAMLGKNVISLAKEKEKVQSIIETMVAGGPNVVELIGIRKDGTEIIVEIRVSIVTDARGQPISMIASLVDITERKRAEENLRKAAEEWITTFDSITDAVSIHDRDFRLVRVNQAFADILNMKREELVGKTCYQVVHGTNEPVPNCPHMKTLETRKPATAEYFESHLGIYLEAATSPIFNDKGEVVASVHVARDITERKRAEEEIQDKNEQLDTQNEELRSQAEELMTQQQELIEKTEEVARANQLKSEFLTHMSHELRTPLNVIIGFSQLMMDEVPGKINEEQQQCLNDVLDSSQHLLNLINEVLDLSRIESGRVELKLENVALPEVIASLTRTMMPVLTSKKQSLDVEVEEGLPPVYTDEGKLAQVLLNLVGNAAKFTPEGGKLRVEAVKKGDWCQVSVIDNGVGIKEEDRERIFEPFCQLENPLAREKNGSGLGLTLVKQIVERYGGQIWVESEYGRGSRFIFTLPLTITNINLEERDKR